MPLFEVRHFCLVYVDDTIIARPNAKSIEEDIKGIGIIHDKTCHLFELCDKGEVGYFIGIRIERQKDLKSYKCPHLKLSQPGLTYNIINKSHIAD